MRSIIKKAAIFISICAACLIPAIGQNLPVGEWRLVSYSFDDKADFPIDKNIVTLNVKQDGHLGGRSGCNVYGGSYSIKKGQLAITDIISTMMACSEPSMLFERKFHAVLAGANDISLANGQLTITDTKTSDHLEFRWVAHPNKSSMPKKPL
jgi:heat shock protein HslJ